jgi:hypothetical protein
MTANHLVIRPGKLNLPSIRRRYFGVDSTGCENPVKQKSPSLLLTGLHTMGLDAALAAAAWQRVVIASGGSSIEDRTEASTAALFFAVWGIYLLDRLWDGQRSTGELLTKRHRFAARHPLLIGLFATVALLFSVFFALRGLSLREWKSCLLIGGLCLCYYLARWLDSEWEKGRAASIGIVFALGILLPVAVHHTANPRFWMLFLGLTGLLISNARLCMEAESCTGKPGVMTKISGVFWLLALSAISFSLISSHFPMASLCGITSILGTMALVIYWKFLDPELLVALADMILFLPPLLLWVFGGS